MSDRKNVLTTSRQTGRLTKRQKDILATNLGEPYLMTPDDMTEWAVQNVRPVLEVGFGMGHSLYEMALANQDEAYCGVDLYRPGVASLLKLLLESPLPNCSVIEGNALDVLAKTPPGSLTRVQYFFPDPWPKKRHRKRRIFHTDFLELVHKALLPGGHLYMVTDWQDYADDMRQSVPKDQWRVDECVNVVRPATKYEMRGQRLGHHISELYYQKI